MVTQVSWQQQYTQYHYSQRSAQSTQHEASTTASGSQTQAASETSETSSEQSIFDVDAVVKNVMNFVNARIAQESDPEKRDQLIAQARSGVEQGFSDARDILKNYGKLDDATAGNIDAAESHIYDALDQLSSNEDDISSAVGQQVTDAVTGGNSQSENDRRVTSSQYTSSYDVLRANKQQLSLSLTTRDGDQVTIGYSGMDALYGSLSASDSGHSVSWSSISGSKFYLDIQGDLDEDEMNAISSLLQDVDALASEFFDGDIETAFQMAQSLEIDPSELSSMNLSLQETDTYASRLYQDNSGEQSSTLPRGLEPLRDYAQHLVETAQKMQQQTSLHSADFLDLLDLHPDATEQQRGINQSLLDGTLKA
ncbi:DUF5610 domain-containing protein [Gynuella sunshinyii]|uniref:DUF5610 domain-containing protein n=1 Tax=Gynuella sunshinyii YC6258 TaxID=1445510 RepID=A0A0C5VKY4_9GAMM|nr:DUF5610 domain-containing protein [Gynuella sunshinyii]AJQ95342.1 hypothetical Protein YC6258_03306 [Gynuella sunshinyii YC6258]